MYGAILGDIIGSRFEFDRGDHTTEFELFTKEDNYTDDTVMTVAVADALMRAGKDASVEEIEELVKKSMMAWGHRYPGAGYGGRFFNWLFLSKNPKPYNSYGNGSAMRVSATGWLYDSLERTREVARATAEVTHNHPEGIKGAECTAAVMYMARTGASKEEIKSYVVAEFGYDMSRSLEELRPLHEHVESCQDSLPKALASFMEGNSYEEIVRNAVSLGGDTDTLAAIAGAMGEAMYGIPLPLIARGMEYIPEPMQEMIDRFNETIGRGSQLKKEDAKAEDNQYIKMAVKLFCENKSDETFGQVLDVLLRRCLEGGKVLVPMRDKNHILDQLDARQAKVGDEISMGEDIRLVIDKIQDKGGNVYLPLYTEEEEIEKGQTPNIRMDMEILTVLQEAATYSKSKGLVINPFGQSMILPKEAVNIVLDLYRKYMEENARR